MATALARADAPPVAPHHLTYSVVGVAEGCPDEAAFRRLVALRLGVDPFVAPGIAAQRTLTVAVATAPPRTVTVTLLDSSGKTLGQRVLREPPPVCEELVANAAFAASVAIDPTVLTRTPAPAPAPPEAPVPPPAPASPSRPPAAEPPASPPPRASEPFVPSLRAGAGLSFGVLTDPAPGFALGASMRRARFSAGVAGRFDLPVESEHEATDATRTRVTTRTSLVLGEVHACAHLRPRGLTPFLCAFVQAGALRGAASGIATAKEDVSAYLAAGPRLGATLPLSESIALDARVDVPFALTTVELRVDDRALWTSPTLGAVAGAGMTFSLP